jgi:DNA invertase Pin-like site-specific DNA recombinase
MSETILRKRDPRKVGYARVSTRGQNLESQIDQLNSVGCHKIFTDKLSGTTMSRTGWEKLLEYLRPNDTIIVTELSRMSRSVSDLMSIVKALEEQEVDILSLKENIDTRSAIGRFFFTVMGAMSQMEIELKSERAAAGRASAKARGRTGGRPRTDPLKLEQASVLYENSDKSSSEICKSLGISRRSFFYHLKSQQEVSAN